MLKMDFTTDHDLWERGGKLVLAVNRREAESKLGGPADKVSQDDAFQALITFLVSGEASY